MGAKNSVELLDIELQEQRKPVRAVGTGRVTEAMTKFTIKPPSFGKTIEVHNAESDEVAFVLKGKAFSSKWQLLTPERSVMTTVKRHKLFSYDCSVYEGSQTDNQTLEISTKARAFSPMVIHADFQDPKNGELRRLVVEGNASDRIVVIYLERGAPYLSTIRKRDNHMSEYYEPIARIHRPSAGLFKKDTYYIEVASGIDVTLVLLFWLVRFKKYEDEQEAAASGG